MAIERFLVDKRRVAIGNHCRVDFDETLGTTGVVVDIADRCEVGAGRRPTAFGMHSVVKAAHAVRIRAPGDRNRSPCRSSADLPIRALAGLRRAAQNARRRTTLWPSACARPDRRIRRRLLQAPGAHLVGVEPGSRVVQLL